MSRSMFQNRCGKSKQTIRDEMSNYFQVLEEIDELKEEAEEAKRLAILCRNPRDTITIEPS